MKSLILTLTMLLFTESAVALQAVDEPTNGPTDEPNDEPNDGPNDGPTVGPNGELLIDPDDDYTDEASLPVGLQFPSCPNELVGQFGGMYHYLTITCPATGTEGFSQSSSELMVPQCVVTGGIGVCGGIDPPPAPRINAETLDQAKQLVADGIAAFQSFKLKNPNATGQRVTFLEGLNTSRKKWQTDLDAGAKTLAEFNDGYDPLGQVFKADKDVKAPVTAENPQGIAVWARFGPGGTAGTWAPVLVDDKRQQNGNIDVTVEAGWTVASDFYLVAAAGTSQIYFRWLDLKKGDKHSYVAFQVDQVPDGETAYPAEFKQKNSYTHIVTWQFGNTPLFATTFADLTP